MTAFVVRIARSRQAVLRGQVEHVKSGERASFSDPRGLLDFLERMSLEDVRLARPVVERAEVAGRPHAPAARSQQYRKKRRRAGAR